MDNNEKLKELFQQAAGLTAKPLETPEKPSREEEIKKAVAIVEEGKTKWDNFAKNMLEGDMADRFQDELKGLSGREYVRVYLKLLEYFKPKVVRVEADRKEEEDNVLRIEIVNTVKEQEKIIDITHEE